MHVARCLLVSAALTVPALASAADKAAPLPSEVRLTDEEKEKVLEAAAASRREPPNHQTSEAAKDDEPAPQIHGEVGFTIGTGGYRSAYGTAIVPLDGDAVAIISLESTDFGSRGRYFDPRWR